MIPRSHTWQHDQIWATGTEDTILSLIKGSFWEYGPFGNGSILQKRKTEIILVRGLRINRENRICLYTDIEKQSQQNIVM